MPVSFSHFEEKFLDAFNPGENSIPTLKLILEWLHVAWAERQPLPMLVRLFPSKNKLSQLNHNENMDILLSFCPGCPGCPTKKVVHCLKWKATMRFSPLFCSLNFSISPIKVSFVKLHYNYEQFSVFISFLAMNPLAHAVAITINHYYKTKIHFATLYIFIGVPV